MEADVRRPAESVQASEAAAAPGFKAEQSSTANHSAETPERAVKADPLLDCLCLVAKLHGRAANRDSLVAGLPLSDGQLRPSLFSRAAKRAGLRTRVHKGNWRDLNPATLPCVVLLKKHKACVLLGIAADGQLEVCFPHRSSKNVSLPADFLDQWHTGHSLLLRPDFQFDARSPEVGSARSRHWFWSVMAENKALYRDVLVAALLINSFAVALPLFVMNVYDRVVPNQATDTLWVLAAGVALVLLGDLLLRTLRAYFIDLAGNRVDVKLSASIMERVLGLRLAERPASAGSFASNLRAFEVVRDFITSATVTTLIDLPFALIFVLVIGWIAWPLTLPLLLGMSGLLLYTWSVQGRLNELTEASYRAAAQRNATLIESLVGLETLKVLGAEGVMQGKWEQAVAYLARIGTQLRLVAASTLHGALWVQQLANVFVIVVGVYLIADNALSMGGLIAAMMLSSRAMAPLGQVAGLLTQYHHARTAMRGLNEVMQKSIERPADSSFVSRPRLRGQIRFRDVNFRYPGEQVDALRGVSFEIKAGEKVALLGRIGSGKTSLFKLLLGLYQPDAGAVLIDGIDARQLDPAELRRQCGYVPQDITLFYGSLRDNLTIAHPQADDAAILRAAQVGGIDEFVDNHPRGFDLLVGERGESLSGGQRQGVAIARAMIQDPPILLLDEPTGSMDFASEELVKQRLGQFARNKTMLLITHRTALLELVDRIIVIDRGTVVADGPKDQVIAALRQGQIGKAA